jgi:hypothetical protein
MSNTPAHESLVMGSDDPRERDQRLPITVTHDTSNGEDNALERSPDDNNRPPIRELPGDYFYAIEHGPGRPQVTVIAGERGEAPLVGSPALAPEDRKAARGVLRYFLKRLEKS